MAGESREVSLRVLARRKSEQNAAVVDPWTLVHLSTGLAFGLMNIPYGRSLAAAAAYEVVEQFVQRDERGQSLFEVSGPEAPLNAVADVVVFSLGHWFGSAWNRT